MSVQKNVGPFGPAAVWLAIGNIYECLVLSYKYTYIHVTYLYTVGERLEVDVYYLLELTRT